MVSSGSLQPDHGEAMRRVNLPAREEHMMMVAQKQHLNFGLIERKKRMDRMKAIEPILLDIQKNLMDYDETFIAPLVGFNMMVTINNIAMLHPQICYTPSTIGYNEDMSIYSMRYEDAETDEWVQFDLNGDTLDMTIISSNPTAPSSGWSNATLQDVIATLKYYVSRGGRAPANLDSVPNARADEQPDL